MEVTSARELRHRCSSSGPRCRPTSWRRARRRARSSTPANGRTPPYAGQVIPGFSGMIDNGDGTFWAMPDNGFGAKGNSGDFLLRLYHITPRWESADGGAGQIDVGEFISLRDPAAPDPVPDRQRGHAGPAAHRRRLRHRVGRPPRRRHVLDRRGVRPVPPPRRRDRQRARARRCRSRTASRRPTRRSNPAKRRAVQSSRGFEAMAASADERFLYPIVEGRSPTTRSCAGASSTSSTSAASGTRAAPGSTRPTSTANVIGDAFMTGPGRMVVIERDDFQGPASVIKRLYEVDLRRTDDDGFVDKELVADLLRIANPDDIGVAASPGAYGVGDPFAFALQSVEVVVGLDDGRYLVGLDNNYPGGNGRIPGTPDDTELIVIDFQRPPRRAAAIRSSSVTVAPAGTGPSTRWPPTSRPSSSAPTTSSRISSPPRTACSSPATRTRSAAPPTSPAAPSSRPPHDQDDRRRERDRVVHRGLHPRRAEDAARRRADPRRSARRTPRSTGCTRCRRSTRCSTSPATPAPATATRSACTRRPSTRPTSTASACRSRSRSSRRSPPTGSTAGARRCSSRASRSATCADSRG